MSITMRLILLWIIIYSFQVTQAEESAKINVKIIGDFGIDNQCGIIIRNTSVYPSITIEQKAQLSPDGAISFDIPLSQPASILFYASNRKIEFFLSPADELAIQLDMDDIDAGVTFEGKGAKNARAYADMQQIQHKLFEGYNYTSSTIVNSIQLINRSYTAKAAYLKKNKKQLSAEFYKISQVDNYATRLRFLLELPNQLATYQRKTKAEVLPANYWEIAKELKLDEKFLSSSAYSRLLSYSYPIYLQNKYQYEEGKLGEELSRAEVVEIRYVELNKALKQQSLRKVSLAYMLQDYIQASARPADLRDTIDNYLTSIGNEPAASKHLNQLYKQYAAISQGQVPPAFSLKKEDGSSLSLADFKGKVVYIDFWASWCGPCRHEMKVGAPALHEAFKDNKDVLFLYISLDEHVDKWKQAIEEDQIKGVHVLSQGGFSSEVAQMFNIHGIPRYMIIDKEGKLFDNNAPRPSMEASQTRIHEALNK